MTSRRNLPRIKSDPRSIRREDVRLDLGTVTIRGTKTDKSDRVVPVLSLTRPFLAAALAWGEHAGRLVQRWTNVGRDLPGLLVGLGYQRATPNDLRRTFASWLVQNGVDLFTVSKLMGHNSTRMVERVYGKLTPENMAAAVAAVPAFTRVTPVSLSVARSTLLPPTSVPNEETHDDE